MQAKIIHIITCGKKLFEDGGDGMMTGSEVIIKCLENEGVEYVFGYPGVAIAPFFDSLYHSSIEQILVRHEQHAGHMAMYGFK